MSGPDRHRSKHPGHPDHEAADFETFYASGPRWSGRPNAALVREAPALTPGTALDVGCGEGADLVWLAEQGWQVTGIDPSATAINRARARAAGRGLADRVWVLTGGVTAVEKRQFDLVTCSYVPFAPDDEGTVPAIEKLVAPGGTLLWVHHHVDRPQVLTPGRVAEQLRDLTVVRLEETHRRVSAGAGAHHTRDIVLIARR